MPWPRLLSNRDKIEMRSNALTNAAKREKPTSSSGRMNGTTSVMKRAIARFAERAGYSLIPRWRLPRLAMAMRLQQIFSDYEIDTVIDVGANKGQYRHFLRHEVGFEGVIESFEPLRELADALSRWAARDDAKWLIHACALGIERGEQVFNRMAASDFSSFRDPLPNARLPQSAKNTVVERVPVQVKTLDEEFDGGQRNLRRTYLKLDTQGSDLDVLAGGSRVIPLLPALQTEISFCPLYDGMPDYKTSIAAFEQRGFSIADLFLVATDGNHRALEFDCVMVRAIEKY
jgi:FkbM family methyltransferase